MNRVIKFRAWDKVNKRMGYFEPGFGWNDEYDLWHLNEVKGNRITDVPCQDNIIMMQYIGVKDRKGVEIYEGDILQDTGDDFWILKYIDACYWLCNPADKSNRNNIDWLKDHGEWGGDRTYAVIGNIYQNSELLKK